MMIPGVCLPMEDKQRERETGSEQVVIFRSFDPF